MNIRPLNGFYTPNINKNVYKNNERVSFKAAQYDDTEDDIIVNRLINTVQGGLIMFSGMIGVLAGIGIEKGMTMMDSKNIVDRFEKVANDPEIKKDTFMVKDVTGDDNPDMILFKKDGSKVVFDLTDGTVK